MFKFLLLISLFILTKCQSQVGEKEEYDGIQEVIDTLLGMYQDPSVGTRVDFLQAARLYLDKLLFLQDEIKAGVQHAERVIRKLHEEGTCKELEYAPFSRLVYHYGWNSLEFTDLENMVKKFKEIWTFFVDELNLPNNEDTTTIQ